MNVLKETLMFTNVFACICNSIHTNDLNKPSLLTDENAIEIYKPNRINSHLPFMWLLVTIVECYWRCSCCQTLASFFYRFDCYLQHFILGFFCRTHTHALTLSILSLFLHLSHSLCISQFGSHSFFKTSSFLPIFSQLGHSNHCHFMHMLYG